jgi:hypothetical protein
MTDSDVYEFRASTFGSAFRMLQALHAGHELAFLQIDRTEDCVEVIVHALACEACVQGAVDFSGDDLIRRTVRCVSHDEAL